MALRVRVSKAVPTVKCGVVNLIDVHFCVYVCIAKRKNTHVIGSSEVETVVLEEV